MKLDCNGMKVAGIVLWFYGSGKSTWEENGSLME
jgi:hypothetical protein